MFIVENSSNKKEGGKLRCPGGQLVYKCAPSAVWAWLLNYIEVTCQKYKETQLSKGEDYNIPIKVYRYGLNSDYFDDNECKKFIADYPEHFNSATK